MTLRELVAWLKDRPASEVVHLGPMVASREVDAATRRVATGVRRERLREAGVMTWEWTGGQYEARVGNVLAEVWYGEALGCWRWWVGVDDGSGVGAEGRCASEHKARRDAEAAMREWVR